jgi:putative ABC transport system ATP-binding protein
MGHVESEVLKQISLDVYEGEMLAIVGASGSGKSTLMNIIGLLDRAERGTYFLQGNDVADLSSDQLAALRNQCMGFVFQQFHLLPRLSAAQNVGLPLTYRDLPSAIIEQRVCDVLTRVGMQSFAAHCPTQLSGGQQQRIAIARALIGEPRVILADEPTGALDSQTGKEIMNLFLALHREGRTIIIVTHDEQIARECERRITLVDGRMITESKQ